MGAEALPPADLVRAWGLEVEGPPWRGFMSSVWPVRDASARELALKVPDAHHPPSGEGEALRAWVEVGAPVVECVAAEGTAVLLQRLDHTRDLERVPEADATLAATLAGLAGVVAPDAIPRMVDETERIGRSIREHHAAAPSLSQPVVDKALATLADVAADLRAADTLELVHWDLHYGNVLATLDGDAWLAIDPLPRAGFREVEVVAPLRNRWAEAVATGDADRALRRRLDLLCEAASLDRVLACALAQAVAVDNVLWLRREGQLDSQFLPPYTVLTRW